MPRNRNRDMPRVPIPVPRQNPRPPASLTLSAKQRLEQEWNEACKIVHAAYVVIGDREDDAIPQLDDDFKWVEAEYELGNNVLPVDEGFLISCTCGNICEDAHTCECQEELPLEEDEDGQLLRTFAYDKNGLFKFDRRLWLLLRNGGGPSTAGLLVV
ncbi:uncharacterized protein PHACADRAFT_189825 [Phanerochaete carnosa HHB-10118-sp]|uniref:Uncharacterized protein n=1 Tax=Phanerochaete carnosa (strain HHB-10118-sp) TaxID=650164 RepID=K5W9R8_PHACS|nr:uncharacterized protein PHACADRAFT_189825 [Phanerochaete carnosa HHB-10118-sp]EKM60703.1 hypothetical protein PHACADRAFT_189825 [Phanerochaete carnosa HHB-10118-sp]